MHHARHLASSEELLDGYDCRTKTILALRFSSSSCVLIYAAFSANLKQFDELLGRKKWAQFSV